MSKKRPAGGGPFCWPVTAAAEATEVAQKCLKSGLKPVKLQRQQLLLLLIAKKLGYYG